METEAKMTIKTQYVNCFKRKAAMSMDKGGLKYMNSQY